MYLYLGTESYRMYCTLVQNRTDLSYLGYYVGVGQRFAHYAVFTNEPHVYSSDLLLVRWHC